METFISLLSIGAGVAIVSFAIVDVFMTVFMIGGGAGPQSALVADMQWRFALRFHKPESERSHFLLRAVGPLIVLAIVACWVIELCLGWALIFVPKAFEAPTDIEFSDRYVFAASAIIGRSANSPSLEVAGEGWEMLNSVAGTTGVIIVSVSLAYVLPVLAAVAHKRSIATTINTLGRSVDDMLKLSRTPGGSSFELYLVSLVAELSLCAERHRCYPVLHYFHSKDLHASLAPAVAKIVQLLQSDLSNTNSVDATVTTPLGHAISNLFEALGRMGLTDFVKRLDDKRLTHLEPIEMVSVSVSETEPTPSLDWAEAYVRFDGWNWEQAVHRSDASGDRD